MVGNTNMAYFSTHLVVGARRLEKTKLATFVALFLFHIVLYFQHWVVFIFCYHLCRELYVWFVFYVGLMAQIFTLYALEHISAKITLLCGPLDFFGGSSASILSAILTIPATSLESFGNLNKASTTHSCNPPKKLHFQKTYTS